MKRFVFPLVLFLTYCILGITTITHYGINWDEPAHFMRGQAFLRFLLEGKKDYSGLPEIDLKSYKQDWGYEWRAPQSGRTIRRSIYQHWERGLMFYTEDIEKRGSHPAFSDVISALFNYVFFIKLGVAPDVFSYNYYVIFTASLLVAGVYIWVRKTFSNAAATVSTLALGLFPVFWAESHNNIKDIPEAAFYSFALFAFYEAVTTKKIKFVWQFGLWCGVAFATKFNIFFLFPTLLLWLLFRWLLLYRPAPFQPLNFFREHRVFILTFLVVPIAMFSLWVITFPAVWFQPKLLLASFSYYKTVGTSAAIHISAYPLYYLLFTTPPIVLLYGLFGILSPLFRLEKRQKDVLLLVLLWFLVPIVRVMLPHTTIYGGIRQIMEYVPALAILAGIGANTFVNIIKHRHRAITLVFRYAVFLSFVPLLLTLIKLHPNEGVYFNSFIGGLKGAKEHDIPDWGQALGNPHRQGILWINKHAEPNAELSLDFELWSNLPHIWVRKDIFYDSRLKSGPKRAGEYVMSVTNKSDFLDWYRFTVMDTFLDPVYQVQVDGVPLLKVWKNDTQYIKDEYKDMKEENITGVQFFKQGQSFTLTLPKTRKILRIEFENADPTLCEEFNDVVGNFQLYKVDGGRPQALRASSYDFNDKITYTKPSFLFAADEAKIIVFNVVVDHPCFSTIRSATVYGIKE